MQGCKSSGRAGPATFLAVRARPGQISSRKGPAQLKFGPDRPSPIEFLPGLARFVKLEIYNPAPIYIENTTNQKTY